MAAVAVHRLALVTWLLAVGCWAPAAEVRPQVLAHGDSERLWVAEVRQAGPAPDAIQTILFYRTFGQGDKWQVLARLPARAVALAGQGSQAGILLDDATWLLLYTDNTVVTAGALPRPARMAALAGGRNAWWAVGVVRGGIAALTTRPTTRAAVTEPAVTATRPTTSRLVLFWLTGNDWKPLSELPGDAGADPAVSLAVIDDVPYVAALGGGGTLHVWHLTDSRWVIDLTRDDLPPLTAFKLLSDGSLPRLWLARLNGPDQLYVLKSPKPVTIDLKPLPGTMPAQRTVTIALGKLSMVAASQGKLVEQDFPIDGGAPYGPPYNLALPKAASLKELGKVLWVAVSIALLLAIFASFRQWPAARGLTSDLSGIALAPLRRRLLAGLIDAAPVILAAAAALRIGTMRAPNPDQPEAMPLLLVVYWAAGLFYVLWMTLIESLAGRSLGKVLMRLRVVGLNGKPPKPAALSTRNVLRLIDVGLFLLPLLMIVAFPLRQRLGDVAAGTLVVSDERGKDDDSRQEQTAGKTDGTP